MIQVTRLKKEIDHCPVLRNITFSAKQGEIISIIGPSGSGKSVLLRCLAGLLTPDGGQITMENGPSGSRALTPGELRDQVALVFPKPCLFPHLRVIENLMLALVYGKKIPRRQACDLALRQLNEVGLRHRARSWPCSLSPGESQRVALARTLLLSPQLLLLDEPTRYLEIMEATAVRAVIRQIVEKGITMLMTTQDIEFAGEISSRVFFLNQGIVFEEGTPTSLFNRSALPQTGIFTRQLRSKVFHFSRSEFDLPTLYAELRYFSRLHRLELPKLKELELYLKKLLTWLVDRAGVATGNVTLTLEYTSVPRSLVLTLVWSGATRSLLDEADAEHTLASDAMTPYIHYSYENNVHILSVTM